MGFVPQINQIPFVSDQGLHVLALKRHLEDSVFGKLGSIPDIRLVVR